MIWNTARDCIEAHADSFSKGTKVLLVDDVLATGGTAQRVQAFGHAGRQVLGLPFSLN